MRTIRISAPEGVGSVAIITDAETGENVDGLTKIIFNDMNVFELWTGTLVFLDGRDPEDVLLQTS